MSKSARFWFTIVNLLGLFWLIATGVALITGYEGWLNLLVYWLMTEVTALSMRISHLEKVAKK